MTNKINIATNQLHMTRGDPRRTQAVVTRMANSINDFAKETDEVNAEMKNQWQTFYKSFVPFLALDSEDLRRFVIQSEDQDSYIDQALGVATTIVTVRGQINSLKNGVNAACTMIVQLRGIERNLNRAVRKVDQALAGFQETLSEMTIDMDNLEQLSRNLPEVLTLSEEA